MDKKEFFKFCFGESPKAFPIKAVISPFIPETILNKKYTIIRKFGGKLFSGVILKHNNEEIVYIKTGIGSSLSGDSVLLLGETLIEEIVFVGTIGGFNGSNLGDLVLCEKAFDGEGFSRYLTHTAKEILEKNKFVSSDNLFLDTFESYIMSIGKFNKVIRGNIFTI